MWKESLYTDGTKEFVSNPFPKLGETVTVYLRAWEDAPVDHIFLRTKKEGLEYLQEMEFSYVNHVSFDQKCITLVFSLGLPYISFGR